MKEIGKADEEVSFLYEVDFFYVWRTGGIPVVTAKL